MRMRFFNLQNIQVVHMPSITSRVFGSPSPHLHVDPLSLYKYMRCCFQGNNSLENWPPEIWMEWEEGERVEVWNKFCSGYINLDLGCISCLPQTAPSLCPKMVRTRRPKIIKTIYSRNIQDKNSYSDDVKENLFCQTSNFTILARVSLVQGNRVLYSNTGKGPLVISIMCTHCHLVESRCHSKCGI